MAGTIIHKNLKKWDWKSNDFLLSQERKEQEFAYEAIMNLTTQILNKLTSEGKAQRFIFDKHKRP